ncbi:MULTISPECIES: helix-turn-helix domain-containing protein [unclassified Falsihalocynthiibacter]|uniref:helix-turn-helix domain-containing protein n=1 Tax=unclassified Falsihalocynthiibacter TaxID=2854191 RepID=UPI00350FCF74
MQKVPITRAAHVIDFCEILRQIGTPIERELARANLPMLIEELPDEYVASTLAAKFLYRCAKLEGIEDLGWLTAERFDSSHFGTTMITALQTEITVRRRLEALFDLCRTEASHISYHYGAVDGSIQIISNMNMPKGTPARNMSEWLQLAPLIAIVRSLAGKNWCPERITFASKFHFSDAAQTAFKNTRIETGASHTSIYISVRDLAISTPFRTSAVDAPNGTPAELDGISILRNIMRPYLGDGTLTLPRFAKIIDDSPRSLQRYLTQRRTNYSKVLESARFDVVTKMLADPGIRMIDIAGSVGYDDQANFGRSFRRLTGMSPGKYRRALQTGMIAAE